MTNKRTIDYSVTITLRPSMYAKSLEQQLDEASAEIYSSLLNKSCYYTLVTEVTKAYNIHYHMIIKFDLPHNNTKNYIRLIYDTFRGNKKIGYVYVKPVDNYDKWVTYMFKNIKETYKILHCRHPVIRNDYEIEFDLI